MFRQSRSTLISQACPQLKSGGYFVLGTVPWPFSVALRKTAPLFLAVLFCFSSQWLWGQAFFLNGSATQSNDTCWVLTPDELWQVGSIWNEQKINLNESFQVLMDMNFGCHNQDGADGIVFGFQPISTSVGSQGEGIGFQGVAPSFGIEFDTWQNSNLDDPPYDHIAIIRDGNMNHNSATNLAGPVQAGTGNIEDCNWHRLRVNWDAPAHRLEVWFDCQLRLSYTGDLVNDIFGGDPLVFWGFTAATGGARNLQQVCFSYTTFLNGFEDVVICPGGQYQLNVSGGVSYSWTPATGLNNPNIPNPIASPDSTTTYRVDVLDACNNPFSDSITVFIDGDTVFFELGPDTTICEDTPLTLDATSYGTNSVAYQWSNGSNAPAIQATHSGLYAVTVTIDDYCVADDRVYIEVTPLPRPMLGADTVLCLEDTLQLNASTAGDPVYLWSTGARGPLLTVSEPGFYQVTAANHCKEAKAGIHVDFEDCQQVYFPNAFSPNDDGINDRFYPQHGGDVELIEVMQIYNRWGALVFENRNFLPNKPAAGWDGRHKAKRLKPAVFTWLALVRFRNGKVAWRSGSVTLMR